jgi:hypothetical protein
MKETKGMKDTEMWFGHDPINTYSAAFNTKENIVVISKVKTSKAKDIFNAYQTLEIPFWFLTSMISEFARCLAEERYKEKKENSL